ncbi:hypothetical protein M4951_07015 [Blastopirellula sp. J2-11]|uniref:hypothetical protein n=1 Tax=Blastopirellula sp. J2-11 TaxID=2943192 RepID=UPI0021C777AD|nr:hypothetical protein [Blastopirellula sp. J2-11]UUO08060.1 hypothetical protein M4951_07015 [Blastopirellula sp. J2-11]
MNYRLMKSHLASMMLAIAVVLIVQVSIAQACPTCKSGFGERYVNAYGWSIIFMMAMPFTLVGAFAAYVFWSIRTKSAAAIAAGSDESVAELAQRKSALGVPTQPPVDA